MMKNNILENDSVQQKFKQELDLELYKVASYVIFLNQMWCEDEEVSCE